MNPGTKPFRLLVVFFMSSLTSLGQQSPEDKSAQVRIAGANVYYVGLLRRGPAWTPERTAETDRIQSEHLAHIGKMAASGKLIGAGPFADKGDLRGVFIFKTGSLDEARSLAEADPAVQSGRLALELHSWMGPKGIGEGYAAEASRNPGAKIPMVQYQFALFRKVRNAAGTIRSADPRLVRDHLGYVEQLKTAGKLVAAGPFTDGGELQGIFVFSVEKLEEAKALADGDPLVKAGVMVPEIHPWMVARGVMPSH